MAKLRLAILGMGRISAYHIEAAKANGRFEVVSTCDNSKVACADYTNFAEMLDKAKPNVVAICTPNAMHYENALMALKEGASVIVEKPLALKVSEAEHLFETSQKRGLHVFPVYQNRFNPTIAAAKTALDEGKFGRLRLISANILWHRDTGYYNSWRADKSGGVVINQASHYIDLIHWFAADKPASISTEDDGRTAAAAIRFENGIIASLTATTAAPSDFEGSLTIIGDKGLVKIAGPALNSIAEWQFADKSENPAVSYDTKSVYGFGHKEFYRAAAATLEGLAPFPISHADALKSLDLLLKIAYNK
ncbi:MAG: Gfo/Idh/MocA family oxidoreductase [Rickettsiales bacterium]|jgi:UDP-N-acetyl-2-amino-2-deoxyglucuronate dehydrogenase|nr:Gfo/Idh/MocA family oxidoreductase [Rickettsiales bacterium]